MATAYLESLRWYTDTVRACAFLRAIVVDRIGCHVMRHTHAPWRQVVSEIDTYKSAKISDRSLPKSSDTGIFSELNQYRSSIGAVSDQYE